MQRAMSQRRVSKREILPPSDLEEAWVRIPKMRSEMPDHVLHEEEEAGEAVEVEVGVEVAVEVGLLVEGGKASTFKGSWQSASIR
mmetsp:Transcript_11078/g.18312  ORF Transcript_11078/g.18312 Transcript_11078/m.18312 type:complete len:85 (-) Transcript_11078:91-345(-)